MKTFYFPKKFLYFFFDPCFYATVQKFRMLAHVLLLLVTCNNTGHDIKGPGKCFPQSSFLIGKAYLRKADASICYHNKK